VLPSKAITAPTPQPQKLILIGSEDHTYRRFLTRWLGAANGQIYHIYEAEGFTREGWDRFDIALFPKDAEIHYPLLEGRRLYYEVEHSDIPLSFQRVSLKMAIEFAEHATKDQSVVGGRFYKAPNVQMVSITPNTAQF
jgi:hypothetical protein